MNAEEEKRDAVNRERTLAARKDNWKSRVCRNSQLRSRQEEEDSGFYGNSYQKRELRRQRKKKRMLDLIGLEK